MLATIFAIFLVLVILGFVYWLFTWAIAQVGLPEPFAKVAQIVMVVIVVAVILLYVLPKVLALGGVSL